jgi:hypothetical protein
VARLPSDEFPAKRRRWGKDTHNPKTPVWFQIASEIKVGGRQSQKRDPFQS